MSKSDREVLHITDVKAIQNRISTSSGEKWLYATAEYKVLQRQVDIKNGAVAEANSAIVDLGDFNVKAAISAALQHVKNADQAHHMLESSTQLLATSLYKARQSLEEGWQDTPTVSFGIKHAAIAMADVRVRAVNAGLRTLS